MKKICLQSSVFLLLAACASRPALEYADGQARLVWKKKELATDFSAVPPEIQAIVDWPQGDLFIYSFHPGDSCPIMHRLIQVLDDRATATAAFGNCDAASQTLRDGALFLSFEACPECQRPALQFRYSNGTLEELPSSRP
jgi:hypothetical protein